MKRTTLLLLWFLLCHTTGRSGEPAISRIEFSGPFPAGISKQNPIVVGLIDQPIDPVNVQEIANDLVRHWIAQGFPQATVQWQAVGDKRGEGLVLTFTSDPGPEEQRRLNTLSINGNELTHPRILLREVPLAQGELLTNERLRRVQNQLENTALFSKVTLIQQPTTQPGFYDLEIEVEERPTGRVETGISYANEQGAVFLFKIQEQNFAFSPPWRGDALQPSFTANVGSEILLLDARLRNPRLGYSFWGLSAELNYKDNQYLSDFYSQESFGTQVFVSHPLGIHQLVALGVGFTHYEIYDVDSTLEEDPFYSEDSNVNLSAVYGIWQLEDLNRSFRPTRGYKLFNKVGLGTPLLGGDTEVLQYEGKAHVYLNPFKEHVLIIKGGGQSVDPIGDTDSVPLPLREWLGGVETLRGFAYHSVSPFNENGVPVGGLSSWWSAVEYMIPVSPYFDASVYYEFGNTSESAWDLGSSNLVSDWGIGLLVRAENFPVRFDVAFPLKVLEGDLENEKGDAYFSFSVGYRF